MSVAAIALNRMRSGEPRDPLTVWVELDAVGRAPVDIALSGD
jgi:hypothetical protein